MNVLTLMTGTALSQILLILISPILTRLYSPADFGTYALFTSLTSAIAVIAAGRYELAVILPRRHEEAFNLMVLSLMITAGTSLVTLLVLSIFNQSISRLLGDPLLSPWLYYVAIAVLFTSFYQIFNYWSNRKKQYKKIAISRITQSSGMAVVSLSLGFFHAGASGLIFGTIAGFGLAAFTLALQNWSEDKQQLQFLSKITMKEQATLYRDFPKINSLHAFIDMLQLNGIVFITSAFFGSAVLGYYTLTMRVLKLPLNFMGKSIAQVFYQKATETYNTGENLHVFVKRTLIRLSIIALPIFAVLIFVAPFLFTIVFGQEWREAGVYTQILCPWICLNFIYSPVSQVPLLVNKQKQNLLVGIFYNILIFGFIMLGYSFRNIKIGFYLISIFVSLYLIGVMFWLLSISKEKPIEGEPVAHEFR